MEIWFNPSCSKCRTARTALEEAGVPHTERRYLDQPPTVTELETVLAQLRMEPWELARTGDAAAKDAGLRELAKDAGDRAAWIEALVAHPRLIQRPIIVRDDGTAVVARDSDTLDRVIDGA